MTRRTFLRVTKRFGYVDENITRLELENGVSAGIRWGCLGADMVPIFEEQAARIENHYKMDDWFSLDEMERAMIIAVRRIDIAAKNQQAEAEYKKAKQDSKRGTK